MEKVVQTMRESYFVYIEDDRRVTIPDLGPSGWVEYIEISKETVKNWPHWLRGMCVRSEDIIWL